MAKKKKPKPEVCTKLTAERQYKAFGKTLGFYVAPEIEESEPFLHPFEREGYEPDYEFIFNEKQN